MPIRTQAPRKPVDARGVKKLTKKVGPGKSHLEHSLSLKMQWADIPQPEEEYQFAAEHVGREKGVKNRLAEAELRNWRFDFAWPDIQLAVEVEGGTYSGGRHTRGKGFEGDAEKYNAAAILGWHVLRFTSGHIKSGYAIRTIKKYFQENNV